MAVRGSGGLPERFNKNGWGVSLSGGVGGDRTTRGYQDNPKAHLRDSLVAAVRIGDDIDTVAAIAGGLPGARWGTSALPDGRWQVIHGSQQNGSPVVGVLELEPLALGVFAREAERQQGSPICLSRPGCLHHPRQCLGSTRFP